MISDEICPICGKNKCMPFGNQKCKCSECGEIFATNTQTACNEECVAIGQGLIIALKATSINLKTLHRNLVGGNWFFIHQMLGEYYDAIDEFEDSIVENMKSIGVPDISIKGFSDKIIDVKDYSEEEALQITKNMFDSILQISCNFRECFKLPSTVAPAFDELENWLQIEANYKMIQYFEEN